MEKLMQVSCDPTCGFHIESHDRQEIVRYVQMHAKKFHKMDVSDKDVMAKMAAARGE
jgi:predicted small metal-binding protein